MNDLDARIREALRAEDIEILSEFAEDRTLRQEVLAIYTGRRRWVNAAAMCGTVVLFLALVVCGYQFFQVEPFMPGATRNLIGWATGFLALFMWLALMKIWFWLELVRNNLSCEVKRLELQVALLSQPANREV